MTDDRDDPLALELADLDARIGWLLNRIQEVEDRRRGARLVREVIEVLQNRGSDAATVRLYILDIVDQQTGPDLDTLAEILGPEGKPVTRQAASKLRQKARATRRANANREGAA